jgi:hypothetical protein
MQPRERSPAAPDPAPPATWAPVVIEALADADPRAVAAQLGIGCAPAPVLVVCGGADGLEGAALARAASLLSTAVAGAVGPTAGIVVDGGTDAGVMRLAGRARATNPRALPALVGVAPRGAVASDADGAVALEPHHTHVVLAEGDDWGDETPLLLSLADALAEGAPVILVMAGGGDVALREAEGAARRGWPIFAIVGTGGIADRLADAYADGSLSEMLPAGDVRPVRDVDPAALARRLRSALAADAVLQDAWSLFTTYDRGAARLRRTFERFQIAIILFGLVATLLALLYQELGTQPLRWAVVAAPIVVSALVAVATRRAAGKRWVVLRAAAESIKSETFRYRTRTGVYADETPPAGSNPHRREVLAGHLAEIQSRLMHSEASSGTIAPSDAGSISQDDDPEADDGLQALDADAYLRLRLQDQIDYYQRRVRRLERRRSVLQIVAIGAGGAGALVAAAGAEVWVALTTAVAAAPPAYLAYLQVDSTIVAYNQAAARLDTLSRGWRARAPAARTTAAFDDLVTQAETVLITELGGWMEQMVNALRELQERHQRDADQHVRA